MNCLKPESDCRWIILTGRPRIKICGFWARDNGDTCPLERATEPEYNPMEKLRMAFESASAYEFPLTRPADNGLTTCLYDIINAAWEVYNANGQE